MLSFSVYNKYMQIYKNIFRRKSSFILQGEKRLLINDIIAPFDLEIKLKKIESFLSKDYEVLIIVQSSSKADEDSSKLTVSSYLKA